MLSLQPASTGTPTNGFDAGHAHAALRELIDHGVEIVRTLVQQAKADPVPHPFWGDKAPVDHPTEHIARCYDRITRSIRRTIALAKHLDDPVRARPSVEPTAPKAAPKPANDARPERSEPAERPDEPDWNEDFDQDLARPLGEVITELQAGLGLPPSHYAPSGPPEPGTAYKHQPASPKAPPTPPTTRKPSG